MQNRRQSFAIFSLTALLATTAFVQSSQAVDVTVDPANARQTFEHWGTSLCWWANGVGDWQDSVKRNLLLDLIFDQSFGLGLNQVRYNIGGGENPAHYFFRPAADIPGYQPSPGVWDWSADPHQRYVLEQAIERGVTRVDAFSNSPPWWMTISGSTTGGVDGTNNLREDMFDEFAEYLATVVRHFRDDYDIPFTTITPINEPAADWWAFGGNQEGCYFDRQRQARIIKELGRALQNQGVLDCPITAPEEYSLDWTIDSLNSYDAETVGYIGHIGTHTYGGSNRTGLANMAAAAGIPLTVSEYGDGTTSNFESMFYLARQIARDVNTMRASGWTYWQVVEAASVGDAATRWGMITANYNGPEAFTVLPKYYGYKQFTANIAPGSIILHPGGALEDRVLLALHPQTGILTIVAVNSADTSESLIVRLGDLPYTPMSASRIRTSNGQNYAHLSAMDTSAGQLNDTLPAKSITSYKLDTLPNPTQRWTAKTEADGWSTANAAMMETDDNGVFARTLELAAPPTAPAYWHVQHAVLPTLNYPHGDIDAWYKHPTATTVELKFDENERHDGWLPDGRVIYQDPPYLADTYVIVGNFQGEIGDVGDWNAASTLTVMRDDGQVGDAVAGDGIYTLRLTIPIPGTYSTIALADRSWDTRITTIGPITAPHNNFIFDVTHPGQTVTFHCDVNHNRLKAAPRDLTQWRGLSQAMNGPGVPPSPSANQSAQDLLDQYDMDDDGDVDLADVAAYTLALSAAD